MPSIITKKLGYENAKYWRDSVYRSSNTDTVLYVFLGKHTPWDNEASPDTPVDTVAGEKSVWDNMYAAKKVTAQDIELVIPKNTWTANVKYRNYDDEIDFSTLLTSNTAQGLKPMYIITTNRNVYKCMSNNASANSTVEPAGDYTTSNGNIATADGYLWKYMYNVKPSNRFLTADWIPAPISTNQLDYNMSDTGVVDGELTTIIVTNQGTGYYNSTITVSSFIKGCSTLTLANTVNVSANMTIAGTGIYTGSYINSVDTANAKITLSTPATANGGGTGNNATISTRVYIYGDGTGAVASASIAGGNVTQVTVSTIGSGYSRANAYIYGSGTSANARVIISPKYGHAYNPADELGGSNVMIASRIGEIDATEGGLISANTSFRQFGLLADPHKYGSNTDITYATANSVVSLTTDLTIIAGSSYNLDELVYQGSSANTASFYGYVVDQTSNEIYLTNIYGTPTVGLPLTGGTSAVSRTVIGTASPELQPYTGDIVYAENAVKVERENGQSENIKFVVRF